jgi:hypothetical protein
MINHYINIVFAIFIFLTLIAIYACNDTNTNCETFGFNPEFSEEDAGPYRTLYPEIPNDPWLSDRGLLPWWNSTRFTRNMSYDLRGDIQNPIFYTGPWNISPII